MTSERPRLFWALGFGVLVAVIIGTFWLSDRQVSALIISSKTKPQEKVYLSTTTIPVLVSGVVSATDSTIIYSQTAGVVTDLLTREGSKVTSGSLLVRQSTPVFDAERQLVVAQSNLANLQQGAAVAVREGGVETAGLRTYSASEIANLRDIGTNNRVNETSDSLMTSAQSSVLTAIEAINYINNNRSLFSAEGLRLYDEVVSDLYGRIPNYFRGGITRPVKSTEDILALLKDIQSGQNLSPLALPEVSVLMNVQLEALSYLFSTAESDIFDRESSFVTSDIQNEYLIKRSSVLASANLLQVAQAKWQQVIDGALEEKVSLGTNVAVTEVDQHLAESQAEYARQIALQSSSVGRASEAVVSAQQSLGQLKAPFAGVVSRVHVEKGEYVIPGTPLLTLVGSGARELEVSVPAYLLRDISVGQTFIIGGAVVGFVERFSSVSEGGSGSVIISLSTEVVIPVGSSIMGSLIIETSESVYSVPRAFVHFASDGPYLQYESGKQSPITIVYDTGSTLFLKVSELNDLPLVPANSISLK